MSWFGFLIFPVISTPTNQGKRALSSHLPLEASVIVQGCLEVCVQLFLLLSSETQQRNWSMLQASVRIKGMGKGVASFK